MSKLQTTDEILSLANGDSSDREGLTADEVRKQTQLALQQVQELLNRAYDLTYLESTIHCDSYHEGKNSFSDIGFAYGYINAYVRRESGTNTLRFAYRRPTTSGNLIRKNISPSSKGYTKASFRHAAHDYELNLALLTEEQFSRLRDQGKVIKSLNRKLRNLDILKSKIGEAADE